MEGICVCACVVMTEQAECYHYLFEAALRLHQLGLDPADPKHSPLLPHNSFEPSRPLVVPNVSSNKNGAKSNGLFSPVSCTQ
jgi:hypothetical protein